MVSHRPTAWTGGAITHFVVVFGQFQVRTARGGARTGSFPASSALSEKSAANWGFRLIQQTRSVPAPARSPH
jgi:hypothetical protein